MFCINKKQLAFTVYLFYFPFCYVVLPFNPYFYLWRLWFFLCYSISSVICMAISLLILAHCIKNNLIISIETNPVIAEANARMASRLLFCWIHILIVMILLLLICLSTKEDFYPKLGGKIKNNCKNQKKIFCYWPTFPLFNFTLEGQSNEIFTSSFFIIQTCLCHWPTC